jgi:hypothetical protein
MRRRLGSVLAGLVLGLAVIAPAAAQDWWPAYGNYGYGTGFENSRNPYGYPRAPWSQGRSVPQDDWALYGGYMPNTYYNGMGYARERAVSFPSGRAYCQTAGSYLYCADIQSGGGQLMSVRDETAAVRATIDTSWLGERNSSVYGGVLATRTVGNRTELLGTLLGPQGESASIECSGPAATLTSLTCR